MVNKVLVWFSNENVFKLFAVGLGRAGGHVELVQDRLDMVPSLDEQTTTFSDELISFSNIPVPEKAWCGTW